MGLAEAIHDGAVAEGEPAGAPMLLPALPLNMADNTRFPCLDGAYLPLRANNDPEWPEGFELLAPEGEFFDPPRRERHVPDDWVEVNEWFSRRLQSFVTMYRTPEGRTRVGYYVDPLDTSLRPSTLGRLSLLMTSEYVGQHYRPEAERAALKRLRRLVTPRQYRAYTIAGLFTEKSPRSKVKYLFRRMRPTVALRWNEPYAIWRPLAALCGHGLGYYDQSYGGALCPTDDVITHLMWMRGDEHAFWKRCEQHPPDRAAAGI